jgi:hypothetical protein
MTWPLLKLISEAQWELGGNHKRTYGSTHLIASNQIEIHIVVH